MSGKFTHTRGAQAQALDEWKALAHELDSGVRQLFAALGVNVPSDVPGDFGAADWSAAIHRARNYRIEAETAAAQPSPPTSIPMLLWCPACGERHIDRGEFAEKDHHTHACQHCGMVWRPAVVATTGVEFLPGFKSE